MPGKLHADEYAFLQFKEYLERAEYVKSLLDGQQPAEPAANGATGQKMKPGGGGDKDVSKPSLWPLVQGTHCVVSAVQHLCKLCELLAHPRVLRQAAQEAVV